MTDEEVGDAHYPGERPESDMIRGVPAVRYRGRRLRSQIAATTAASTPVRASSNTTGTRPGGWGPFCSAIHRPPERAGT
jgi:hypothetical protein